MRKRKITKAIALIILGSLTLAGCSKNVVDNSKEITTDMTMHKTENIEESKESENEETTTQASVENTTPQPPTENTTTELVTDNPQVNNDYYYENISFNGAAFLGDSRTEGLNEKGIVSGADFYTSIGISVNEVIGKKNFLLDNGSKGSMLEAVSQKEYSTLYLMFGINELGWPYKETFVNCYETIVNTLKARYPNAKIYLQSILPMVEGRTDNIYNNTKIRLFNTYIEEVAQKTNVNYIDTGKAVMDEQGGLPQNASKDGIHLNKEYCFKWAVYLHDNTVE